MRNLRFIRRLLVVLLEEGGLSSSKLVLGVVRLFRESVEGVETDPETYCND